MGDFWVKNDFSFPSVIFLLLQVLAHMAIGSQDRLALDYQRLNYSGSMLEIGVLYNGNCDVMAQAVMKKDLLDEDFSRGQNFSIDMPDKVVRVPQSVVNDSVFLRLIASNVSTFCSDHYSQRRFYHFVEDGVLNYQDCMWDGVAVP